MFGPYSCNTDAPLQFFCHNQGFHAKIQSLSWDLLIDAAAMVCTILNSTGIDMADIDQYLQHLNDINHISTLWSTFARTLK